MLLRSAEGAIVDQSSATTALYNGYGGSDNAEASFNRPRYVRFYSVHKPRDFGTVEFLDLDLEGVVGAESGTQTLFFRFTITRPAKIGLRKIRLNRYTDQYITIALRDGDGNGVPLGADGFAGSTILDRQTFEQIPPQILEIGYALCGYWENGYAEYDCFSLTFPPRITIGDADADDPFGADYGVLLPAGPYTFTVSSSQWPQLPYRIQVVVAPQINLAGSAELQLTAQARLSLVELGGLADLRLEPSARIPVTYALGGEASFELRPQAGLTQQSPFG